MEGYIYCFSNPCMPGLLKVGMIHTEGKTPDDRAKELFTTGVPCPFTIEFAKKVKDPKAKEALLHKLLEQYTERYSHRREFFRVSPEEVRSFVDLMDGEMWTNTPVEELEEADEDDEETKTPSTKSIRKLPDLSKYFINGQRIRHVIGVTKIWEGSYNSEKNAILYNGTYYSSISGFALKHHQVYSERTTASGWAECDVYVTSSWVSAHTISEIK